MEFDLLLGRARLADAEGPTDRGVTGGIIAAIAPVPMAALPGISQVLMGFKRGRRSFARAWAELHPPG